MRNNKDSVDEIGNKDATRYTCWDVTVFSSGSSVTGCLVSISLSIISWLNSSSTFISKEESCFPKKESYDSRESGRAYPSVSHKQ